MTQPIICNSDAERPIFPVDCPDGWWAVPVTDLSEIKKPDRDHAYLLPDNSVWILNYDGTAMVQLNDGDTSSGQPTQITNKDGYITITGSGTHSVTADLSEDLVESIDTAVKDIQLSDGQLTFTKNDESQIDIKLGEGLSVKDNEIFVDVEDKNEPTKLKNTDGYLEISGSGTHDVTIDVDYDELMSDFYTKEESDNNMFEAITGNTLTIDTTFDFKNKVSGSVVENPHMSKIGNSASLLLPTSSILVEIGNSHYRLIASQDGGTSNTSVSTNTYIHQRIFSFNVIEAIGRKYPNFFDGLNTMQEKTAKISTISKVTYNVYGYASGPNSTTLSTAFCPVGSNPWGTVIKTDSTKPVRNGRTLASGITKNIFDDNGFVHIIAFAPVSDGTTPSALNIDYANFELSLTTSATDIYSLKSEVYTKEETDEQIFEAINGGTVSIKKEIDFKNKKSGSVVENPHFVRSVGWDSLRLPNANSTTLIELSQAGYNDVARNDDKICAISNSTNKNMMQVIIFYNVIEEIKRHDPNYFENRGAITLAEQVAVAKTEIISMVAKNSGYGSGADGNRFSVAVHSTGGVWDGTKSHSNNTVAELSISASTQYYLHDNGYFYVIAYAPLSDGTTASVINLDCVSLELTLATNAPDIYALKSNVYTKEETDEQIFEAVSGDMQTVTNVMDLNSKITGSVVENPNTAKMLGWDSLRPPTSTAAYEMNQDRYNGMKTLADGKMYNVTHITSGNLLQVIFGWNIIEDIERRYPELFTNLGATTIAEKIEVSNKLLQEVTYNVYGYGSAPNSTALTTAPYSNGANDWGGTAVTYGETVRKNGRTIPKVDIHYIIQDDGFVYVIAYAAATDGVTPSTVVIDYASLEYSLAISAADIYALKKDVYAKQEVEERLLDTLSGEPIFMTEAIDFMYKGTGSTVANSNIAKWGGGLTIQQPSTTTFTELNQARYDTIKKLDEKTADVQTTTNNSMIQMLFRWNLVEDIERKYPYFFTSMGAKTTKEKAAVLRSGSISSIITNAWLSGSGANATGLKLYRYNNLDMSWVLAHPTTVSGLAKVTATLKSPIQFEQAISDEGYFDSIVIADPSNGTTASSLSVDYTNLEYTLSVASSDIYALKNEVYTKQETDKQVFETVTGETVSINEVADLKQKISGSMLENPSITKSAVAKELLLPAEFTYENTQAGYNQLSDLDGVINIHQIKTNETTAQRLFAWNIVEDIERKYPNLFENLDASALVEKVAITRKIVSQFAVKAYGFGSGASGNRLTMRNWGGVNNIWYGGQTHTSSEIQMIQQVIGQSNNYLYINNDGYIYVLLHAPASDGEVASIVNIDYANLEYTLTVAATDIYALKKNTYTKTESDAKFYRQSQEIFAKTDLNNLREELFFNCPSNVTVATLLNCPVTDAFSLQVNKTTATGFHQRLVTYSITNPRIYERNYFTSWGEWQEVAWKSQVDLKADISAAQMQKIMADDGTRKIVLSNASTLLADFKALKSGVHSIALTTAAVEGVAVTNALRGLLVLGSGDFGNFVGVDDSGKIMHRAIAYGAWANDWIVSADASKAQMKKITTDSGTPLSEIASGSLLDFIKAMPVSYRTVSVSSAVTDRPPTATTFRGTIQKVASNNTGNVVLISDTGRVFTRTFYGGEWYADWVETADSSKAQMNKITNDNGGAIATIPAESSLLDWIVANGRGYRTVRVSARATDVPQIASSYTGMVHNMDIVSSGNVKIISDTGRYFVRAFYQGVWSSEWAEITDKYTKFEMDEKLNTKIGLAEEIPVNADLNTYLTEGFYKSSNNANAATLINCPVGSAFNLQVIATSGVSGRAQILTTYTTTRPLTYYRATVSGTFGNWYVRNDSITLEGDVTGTWTGNNAANATALISTSIPKLAEKMDRSILIGENQDLNTLNQEGFYRCSLNATALTILNKPEELNQAFSLIQQRNSNDGWRQVIYNRGTLVTWERLGVNGSWSAWKKDMTEISLTGDVIGTIDALRNTDGKLTIPTTINAQKQKITADDGRPIATLTSGSILEKIKEAAGVMSFVSIAAVTDHPPTTDAFRFMSQMTSTTYGNVIGMDDKGDIFVRSVQNGNWKTDWKKLASTTDIEQSKLIAGADITIDNNVISTTLSNKIDAQALLNGVNIGGKYRNELIQNIFFLYQSKDFKLSELIDFEKAVVYRGMKGQDVFQLTAVSELDEQNISEQETDQEVKSFVCNLTVSLNREYLYYVNLVINYEGEQYSMMKEITQYG